MKPCVCHAQGEHHKCVCVCVGLVLLPSTCTRVSGQWMGNMKSIIMFAARGSLGGFLLWHGDHNVSTGMGGEGTVASWAR